MSLRWLKAYEDFWFRSTDARIYELFRIAFGLVALLNISQIWPIRHALFSENGMIGPDVARMGHQYAQSIFWYFNSTSSVDVALIIAVVACVFVVLGLFTRFAILVAFLWHVSSFTRMDLASSGWDALLNIYSAMLLVSPIGKVWSLDALRRGERFNQNLRSPVYGLRLIQIQVTIMYWQTAWFKIIDLDWQRGYGVAYFFMSSYSFFHGSWIYQLKWLSPVLTYLTLSLETLLPFFLWSKRLRSAGMLLGFVFHFIIGISDVYLFSFAALTAYIAFLDDENFRAILPANLAIKTPAG